jgi:PKD repeat protein
MKKQFSLLSIFLLSNFLNAQSWVELIHTPGKNFYEVQAAANDYFKDKDKNEKGIGLKPFKRWEHFMEPRVYPSGDLSLPSTNWKNFEEFLRLNSSAGNKSSSAAAVGTWTAMGPMGPPSGTVFSMISRTGRDNFITFHPTIPSTFWVGAAAGGLWKTTNSGASWTTNTDNLSVIGCSDLAIDPSNPNTMYLATGDGEAGDTYCIGVLKSIDGGLTWNASGLVFTVNQMRQMRRLIINPSNPQILMAATSAGIFRTTNGGTSWTTVVSGDWHDVEFKPGDPTTVYIGGNTFRKSTDGGATFSLISTGIATSGTARMNIAVTPADPNYVYVLRALSSGANYGGFGGLYRSTNSGTSFSTMMSSPDILSNPCNASGGNAQGWYDLACAASPLNANEVVVGGINVWRSTNGGSSMSNIGCWNSASTNPLFVHADHHELEYTPTGTLYSANDGGICVYNGTSWTDITAQRNISQIYKIGTSAISPNLWIIGLQDNGTFRGNNGTYTYTQGGDGMDCFIDRTNNSNMFCSSQYGNFRRSSNGGGSWSGFTVGLPSGGGPWVAPWKQDPITANLYYAGYSQMYVNTGGAWSQLTNTGGSGDIVEFAIAPSNNQVIYVIHGTSIRKTIDAGLTWINISSGIPGSQAAPSFITIDPNDENTVWVTLSGYSAANKVFKTTNGGANWVNITANLPNLPANCSVYQPGTNDRIYIGMDVGVYTRDNSSNTWTLFNTALPNTPIADMEISPAAPTLLRAATYGRGVYETELVQPTIVPTTSFVATGTICSGVDKSFTDLSSEAPTSWAWTVNPAAGVLINSSTSQNPLITFPSAGVYTVSLIASNGIGAGSTLTKTISVANSPVITLNTSVGTQTVCMNEDITLTAGGANTYTWLPGPTTGSTTLFNGILGNDITYTVTGRSTEGCTSTEILSIVVSECTGITNASLEKLQFEVYPNPATNQLTIKSSIIGNANVQLEVIDASGKVVIQQTAHFKKDKHEQQINISGIANGIYILKLNTEDGTSQQIKIVKE